MRWVAGALLLVVGCGGAETGSEPAGGSEVVGGDRPEVTPEPEPRAEPPDPHPVIAGFARELRAWLTESEVTALEGIELTGTAGGDTEELAERVRHVLFRELAGPAILGLGIAELRRYGEDIREMPEGPEGFADDEEPSFGGWGEGPHMNIDGMGNAVGDLQGQCDAGLSEAQRAQRPNRCDERFAPVWAAVKLARTAYDPLDVEAMGFVDPGRPLGGGEWDRAEPVPLHELLTLAHHAGLERAVIVEVAVRLLRDLVTAARAT